MNFLKNNFIFILILIIIISLSGCSSVTPTIVTKEVLVPVKCEMSVPERPTKVESTSKNVSNILEYTEKLETIVEACVKNTD